MPRETHIIDGDKIDNLCAALVGTKYEDQIPLIREQNGCPVVENTSDETKKTVTFFYVDEVGYESVSVSAHGLANAIANNASAKEDEKPIMPAPEFPMERIGTSNVWVLSLDVPADSLLSYKIKTSASTDSVYDSLNPRRFSPSLGDESYSASIIDLTVPFDLQQLSEERRVDEQHKIKMAEMRSQHRLKRYSINDDGVLTPRNNNDLPEENERMLTVHLPQNYDETRLEPYPVRIFLDGGWYSDGIEAPSILNDQTINIMLEPKVFHHDPEKDREYEYNITPIIDGDLLSDNNIKTFTAFLANQFMLALYCSEDFHISSDASQHTIFGSSLSGFAATYIGLHHPEIFGNILTQSAALWLFWPEDERGSLPVASLPQILNAKDIPWDRLGTSCFYRETHEWDHESIRKSNVCFDALMRERQIPHRLIPERKGVAHEPVAWQKYLPEAVRNLQEMKSRLDEKLSRE